MCDYSLQHAKSRPAAVADKLVVHDFGRGTKGFCAPEALDTAVCVLPGTEIAFTKPVEYIDWTSDFGRETKYAGEVAIFRQLDKDKPLTHHDALEFPDGLQVLLTRLSVGLEATVLQLPAAPKTEAEAEEQKRLEVVG
jgi:hypothetical protein